jgi:hypothetical protein
MKKTFAIATLSALAACGGSADPVETSPTFADIETLHVAYANTAYNLPAQTIDQLPVSGTADYEAALQVNTPAPSGQATGSSIARGLGKIALDFAAGDTRLTGSFDGFVATDDSAVSGTVTLDSTGVRSTAGPGTPANAIAGVVAGTLTGSGTGTVLDAGLSMNGDFVATIAGTGQETAFGNLYRTFGSAYEQTGQFNARQLP